MSVVAKPTVVDPQWVEKLVVRGGQKPGTYQLVNDKLRLNGDENGYNITHGDVNVDGVTYDIYVRDGVSSLYNSFNGVFVGSSGLINAFVPDSVTIFGFGAFSVCENLENILISKNVNYFESESFARCNNLSKIQFNFIDPGEDGRQKVGNIENLPIKNVNDEVIDYGENTFKDLVSIQVIYLTNNTVNDEPTTEDISVTTSEDTSIEITLIGSDVDGDDLSYSIVRDPSHGEVTISGNIATYTPNTIYNGTDSFTYQASDGILFSNIATVSITVTPVNDAPVVEDIIFSEEKIIASDGASSDYFGRSVAISGNTAIVGAYRDDNFKGSVYIFEKQQNGSWNEVRKLIANDGASSDYFGRSVAISGNTAIVGAYGDDDNGLASGSAYIFEKQNGSWNEVSKLIANDGASNDYFGNSVAISGNTAIVGAYGDDDNDKGSDSGSAYIFEKQQNGSWNEVRKLIASDGASYDYFGSSVAISGNTAIVGAYGDDNDKGSDSGSAYIFEKQNGSWNGVRKLIANDGASSDYFGYSIAISGNTAIVGAYGDDDNGSSSGSAYIYGLPITILEDTSVNITLLGSDVEGQDLTYSIVSDPSHGEVTISGNIATYTPNPNYNGTDSFTYKANDGLVDSNIATVSITVTAVNDAPEWIEEISSQTMSDDGVKLIIDISGKYLDVDGDTLDISASTTYENVIITISGETLELIAKTRIMDESNNFIVTVIVTDPSLLNGETSFNVVMIRSNTAPLLELYNDVIKIENDAEIELIEEGELILDISVSDLENDNLTYEVSSNIVSGSESNVSEIRISGSELIIKAIEEVRNESRERIILTVSDGILETSLSFIVIIKRVEYVAVSEEVIKSEKKNIEGVTDRSYNARANMTLRNIFNFRIGSGYMQEQVRKHGKTFDSSTYTRNKQLLEYRKSM